MGRKYKDLTGQKFGNRMVISFAHIDRNGRACWNCQCKCGNIKPVAGIQLRKGIGHTCRSCAAIKEHIYKDGQEHKECYKCKQPKLLDSFHNNRHNADGLNDICKQCHNVYFIERRKKDPVFALRRAISCGLHHFLKNGKFNRTVTYIGCTFEELKIHLESKFTNSMTWKNRGGKDGWQIDHIKPVSSFDFTNEEEILKCWHYTNLQPLWAKDNLAKSNKYENNES